MKESKHDNGFYPEKHWRSDWKDDKNDHLIPSNPTSQPNGSTHHHFNGCMGKTYHYA